jgi:hypothetical protein
MENDLIALCKYGKPRIAKMPDGWMCSVDMHVAAKGTSFEVKSDFNCITPSAAVEQVMQRIEDTLKMYGVCDLKALT